MALGTYAELKTAILDWMVRSDLSGNVADWITLAEARLNRELGAVEVDGSLTGVADSREIDVSALSIVEPLALYLIDSQSDETELDQQHDFNRTATSGVPYAWDYRPHATTGKIIFDCPLVSAFTFRFRYRQRFALSDSATTNWLLTYHPDVYLAASIVWGGGFTAAYEQAATFKVLLEEAIPSVKAIIADSKRGMSRVDPALAHIGRYTYQNWLHDD